MDDFKKCDAFFLKMGKEKVDFPGNIENPNFKRCEGKGDNEENPRKSRVFRLASYLSTRLGGDIRIRTGG